VRKWVVGVERMMMMMMMMTMTITITTIIMIIMMTTEMTTLPPSHLAVNAKGEDECGGAEPRHGVGQKAARRREERAHHARAEMMIIMLMMFKMTTITIITSIMIPLKTSPRYGFRRRGRVR
jgi:hypothetical protein